jgi:probable F420-dependent oxidoreductase
VKVDCFINTGDTVSGAAGSARAAEGAGLDAVWCGEVNNDPLLACALAAAATETITVGTGVVAVLARSPMSLAASAHDLARLSRGRFVLGVGSQVRAHVERRYGMPFDRPVARMREYVAALRAIWRCWDEGERLDFRGEFWSHTLMSPVMQPPPNPYGPPPVYLAAVGPRMTELAGETADGLFAHGFTTADYVRDVTLPALDRGRVRGQRPGHRIPIVAPVLVATGRDEDEAARGATATRASVAFYGSTPAYRSVLAHHGWDDLHLDLAALARQGRWAELPDAVDDVVVDAFAVVAPIDRLPAALHERWGGLLDRVAVPLPADLGPDERRDVVERLRVAGAPAGG